MRRFFRFLLLAALIAAGFAFWMTRAVPLDEDALAGVEGNTENGQYVFTAAGCASCHAAPDAKGDDKLVLAGGQKFPSDFGTFIAPNISPDPTEGIGDWTAAQFASAVTQGVSPEGQHYYPAFPYGAYAKMEKQDLADLWAYMKTLPASDTASQPHDVGFPFNIRRALGGWKLLFMDDNWVLKNAPSEQVTRGRYLVETLAHCGECHTPRNMLGGMDTTRWLAGAPNPSGKGRTPGIAPGGFKWTEGEITYYLETGFTPDFDSVGGHMVAVVDNMAELTEGDRQAIAAYLKSVPEQPSE
ncbi:c-type cytochrome [Primorskyibacter marinus]|uniref:cytochrome c n=1 Tax=Primorskyibacter marinus TaxID=1977320 RepID=UPI003F695137